MSTAKEQTKGRCLNETQAYEAGEVALNECVQLTESAYPAGSPLLGEALYAMACGYHAQRQHTLARGLFAKAAAIGQAAPFAPPYLPLAQQYL